MGFFKRMGFYVVLVVAARLIGGVFSPGHPKSDTPIVVASALAAPLDDATMKQALDSLHFHGDGPGAKMTYHSADGPVTLTPNDVAEINLRYHRLKGD